VLTTHYLEEAQELCGRIAMLKLGQVVALDDTAKLMGRFHGGTLLIKVSGAPMPPALAARCPEGPGADGRWSFTVNRFAEVEPLLAELRVAGCAIDEMEMTHTDLEAVFLKIMRQEAA